jgi:hypothetical protein
MARKIVILTLDSSSDLLNSRALLKHLALTWQQQGFEVEVVQGIKRKFEADIIISHIDLTVVPEEYTAFLKKYPVVINREATDISKSKISQNLLKPGDAYDGPVIVKTVANFGGIPELNYQESMGQTVISSKRPWRKVEHLDPHNYPRFESIRKVPTGVWKNKKLIVEKFLSERDDDGNYRLRTWYVFGDRELGESEYSANPIVKAGTFNKVIIDDVPEELRLARKQLGIDFGRFDYAVVDGETIIYDINKTSVIYEPTLELFGDRLSELADGLSYYIGP